MNQKDLKAADVNARIAIAFGIGLLVLLLAFVVLVR